ncbi:hypothetical protein Moror_4290 [Moniliophthora roreri MCA 2997]|uniref:Uncharacterized protein n=1 Tax=Moniliophthora roreri (strain MCA 2997) TaxID=1381753 RepID=V2YFT9_MONRO|nr:hypothetical protein Moror_4290 [Moniliophthora roreri MCA 2997]
MDVLSSPQKYEGKLKSMVVSSKAKWKGYSEDHSEGNSGGIRCSPLFAPHDYSYSLEATRCPEILSTVHYPATSINVLLNIPAVTVVGPVLLLHGWPRISDSTQVSMYLKGRGFYYKLHVTHGSSSWKPEARSAGISALFKHNICRLATIMSTCEFTDSRVFGIGTMRTGPWRVVS